METIKHNKADCTHTPKTQHILTAPYIELLEYAEKIFVRSLFCCRIMCICCDWMCCVPYSTIKKPQRIPITEIAFTLVAWKTKRTIDNKSKQMERNCSQLLYCSFRFSFVSRNRTKIELILSSISIFSAFLPHRHHHHQFVIWFCSQSIRLRIYSLFASCWFVSIFGFSNSIIEIKWCFQRQRLTFINLSLSTNSHCHQTCTQRTFYIQYRYNTISRHRQNAEANLISYGERNTSKKKTFIRFRVSYWINFVPFFPECCCLCVCVRGFLLLFSWIHSTILPCW